MFPLIKLLVFVQLLNAQIKHVLNYFVLKEEAAQSAHGWRENPTYINLESKNTLS